VNNYGNIGVYKAAFFLSATNVIERNRKVLVNFHVVVQKLIPVKPAAPVGPPRIGKFRRGTPSVLSTNLTNSHVHTDRMKWNKSCIGNRYEG